MKHKIVFECGKFNVKTDTTMVYSELQYMIPIATGVVASADLERNPTDYLYIIIDGELLAHDTVVCQRQQMENNIQWWRFDYPIRKWVKYPAPSNINE